MSRNRSAKVGFNVVDQNEEERPPESSTTPKHELGAKKKSLKKILSAAKLRKDSKEEQPSEQSNQKKKDKKNKYEEKKVSKQKNKLKEYMQEEKPIIQTKIEIDDFDRRILSQNSGNPLPENDLDEYFKMPKLKAKKDLWKIPYSFSNDDQDYDDDEQSKSVDRFGTGINDGCSIGLNMPKIYGKKEQKQKPKTWDDLLEIADDALDLFQKDRWNRSYRNRRGSILQPQHIFLTPNPEQGGKFFSYNKSLREWCSETILDKSISGDDTEFLEAEFKSNIVRNASINDLSNMIYPEVKLNFDQFGLMSDSDLQYIQAVSKRRRQSLIPPTFAGDSSNMMSFRRQSFAGGLLLWSAEVESNHQKEVYRAKVALINPDFEPHILQRMNSITTILSADSDLQPPNEFREQTWSMEDYPVFKVNSKRQAKLFANELLLIVRRYFNSIKSSEITNLMLFTMNQNLMNACPHIKGLLHFQNRIIRLIATYVLKEDRLEQRVNAILFFIRVIRHLYSLNNWHSVKLITESLQCPPVVRLKETWRKITFNHSEDYGFFIKISEDLEMGKQWQAYDDLTVDKSFIPIFDDVIESIKERCGLMIVQIRQHRLHSTWGQLKKDDNPIDWIENQVASLMENPQPLNGKRTSTSSVKSNQSNNHSETPSQRSPSLTNKFRIKTGFFKRMYRNFFGKAKTLKTSFSSDFAANTESPEPKAENQYTDDENYDADDDNDDDDDDDDDGQRSEIEEQTDQDIYQHRLLKDPTNVMLRKTLNSNRGSIKKDSIGLSSASRIATDAASHRPSVGGSSAGSKLPSCKRFWSITDFAKLRQQDRELVKQQIVRTLVSYQKRTFYVFEDRSPEIRDFLLNSKCNSMDACMLRSIELEKQQSQQDHSRRVAANRLRFEIVENLDNQPIHEEDETYLGDNQSTTGSTMMAGDGQKNLVEQRQQQVENKPKMNIDENGEPVPSKPKRRVMFAE